MRVFTRKSSDNMGVFTRKSSASALILNALRRLVSHSAPPFDVNYKYPWLFARQIRCHKSQHEVS